MSGSNGVHYNHNEGGLGNGIHNLLEFERQIFRFQLADFGSCDILKGPAQFVDLSICVSKREAGGLHPLVISKPIIELENLTIDLAFRALLDETGNSLALVRRIELGGIHKPLRSGLGNFVDLVDLRSPLHLLDCEVEVPLKIRVLILDGENHEARRIGSRTIKKLRQICLLMSPMGPKSNRRGW
jgi:hypothetical protein